MDDAPAAGSRDAPPPQPSRRSPLHDRHAALGAAFTDFGGWTMPVRYTSDLVEHHAVRAAAGLFDISHMAELAVTGAGAGAFLDGVLAGRVDALQPGRAKYSLVLAEDGGIVDDVIAYRLAPDRFLVIANAANRAAVAAALLASAEETGAADVEDVSDAHALLAVQGPRAAEVLAATPGLTVPGLDALRYYASAEGSLDGVPVLVARTGYTGEDGFELFLPAEAAPALWDALLDAGRPLGLVPAGLAARDTLRLEAGMPLYGHELRRDVLPAQAGLGRVVALDGEAPVLPPDAPVLVGLVSEGRRAGRAGYAVLSADGEVVGEVTSGALSPTLGHPVAMAYVPPAVAETGTDLSIDVRGTRVRATVTPLPFYRRKR